MTGIDAFLEHLRVERAMSVHTLDAYRRDLDALAGWAQARGLDDLVRLDAAQLREFVAAEHRRGLAPKSLQQPRCRPACAQGAAPAATGAGRG